MGFLARYDSRDVPVNAWKGMMVDFRAVFYGEAIGSDNRYQIYQLDLRKYFMIKKPGRTLAVQLESRLRPGKG